MTESNGHNYRFREMEACLRRMPKDGLNYYGGAIRQLRHFQEKMLSRANSADSVAEDIYRALTAKNPKSRYWSGLESKFSRLFNRIASDRMRDAVGGFITGL